MNRQMVTTTYGKSFQTEIRIVKGTNSQGNLFE